MAYDDAEDDDLDDRELPDGSDQDDDEDGSVDTVKCPSCGRQVYEGAQRCPYCGEYISREDPRRPAPPPLWFVVGVIILIIALFVWSSR
jgi:predicted nucleic acid-binding Zn ribbon protein